MPFTQPKQFLTAPEAARHLGGSATGRTVTELIRRGELKGKKVGKGWRILPEWLDDFMSQPDDTKKEVPPNDHPHPRRPASRPG